LKSEVDGKGVQDDNNQSSSTAKAITDPSTRPRGLLEVSVKIGNEISFKEKFLCFTCTDCS